MNTIKRTCQRILFIYKNRNTVCNHYIELVFKNVIIHSIITLHNHLFIHLHSTQSFIHQQSIIPYTSKIHEKQLSYAIINRLLHERRRIQKLIVCIFLIKLPNCRQFEFQLNWIFLKVLFVLIQNFGT